MKLYLGNIPYTATEDEVRELFAAHGAVDAVNLITDRETGRPRGFGFVEMPDDEQARAAIDAIDGTSMGGRIVKVNQARPRRENRGGGGGFRSRDRW